MSRDLHGSTADYGNDAYDHSDTGRGPLDSWDATKEIKQGEMSE
jgi:hypothetical protein